MRLRTLSFTLLITIALLPSLLLSVVIYQKVYQLVELDIEQNLGQVAKQIDGDVLHQVELLATGLSLLSEQKLMRLGMDNLLYSGQVFSALNHFGKNNPLIESLYLVSKDGFVEEAYAGNILALEESQLVKFKPNNSGMMYSSKLTLQQFVTTPWFEYFKNPDLLEQENESDGIAFIVPVHSSIKLNSTEVHGYLVAVVPVSKILEIANKAKMAKEKVNFSLLGDVIGGEPISNADQLVIKTRRIAFSSPKFRNILWLDLNVAQSRAAMINSIHRVMSPVLTTGGIILLISIVLAIVIAHFFSQAFNQLNILIQRFTVGVAIPSKAFFILEFKEVYGLLRRLQKTINQQMHKLEAKNSELLKVNLLREKYLREVRELNTNLEQQVELRTNELEKTLTKVEHSHFVFEQLIQFRRRLESCHGNRAVAQIIFENIKTCLPDVAIALYLPEQLKHRSISRCYNMAEADFSEINKQVSVNCIPEHITRFSVDTNLFGWVMIKNHEQQSQQNSWLTLFITEINSYLMMRSLNENLDMLASSDSLTGLKNRKAFDQLWDKLQAQPASEAGLYIIDVNGLKEVNDKRGHEQGDVLIKDAGNLLNKCTKGITKQVFRIGGDEFAILLNGKDLQFSDKLNAHLVEQQRTASCDNSRVSFSFGYVSTAECALAMLYKEADRKMYIDKGNYYQRRKGDRRRVR